MRFASIGSGSQGNGTLVEKNGTCVLIDCGFSAVEVERRLARLNRTLNDLKAIVVTHEHSDHIRGVSVVARKADIPVWVTRGTARFLSPGRLPQLKIFNSHQAFEIGDLRVQPYPVPHDAREPSQFVFDDGDHRFGLLTDTGCITPHIEESLTACDALMVECNHDSQKLARYEHYPQSVKDRIGGRHGHLSNHQTAELLDRLDCSRLQHVVAAHLSEKTNHPELVQQTLSEQLGCEADWVGIVDQEFGLEWRELR